MKVRTSPNSKFTDIAKIQRVQIAAREAIILVEDEEEGDKSDSTLDCILIEQLFSYIYFCWVSTSLFRLSEQGSIGKGVHGLI